MSSDVVPVGSVDFAGSGGCRVIFGDGKFFIEKVLMSFVRIRSDALVFA